MSIVPITSPHLDAAEVSFFSALCSDDFEFLGVPANDLRSSWEPVSYTHLTLPTILLV